MVDALHELNNGYDGKSAMIAGVFRSAKTEDKVIEQVMRLKRANRLLAFAVNPNTDPHEALGYPQYIVILEPYVSRGR
jgi:hypothetical protein